MMLASALFIWLTLATMHALALCWGLVARIESFPQDLAENPARRYFKLGQDVIEAQ